MKLGRDHNDDAGSRRRLDDATAEALIAGDTGAGTDDLAKVSAFLDEVRALGEGPPPSPSPALARMLAGEPERPAGSILRLVGQDEATGANHPAASNGHRPRADAGSKRPAAGVVARAAALALVATAAVTGAAAARLLPEPAQNAVSRAIETVTPFEVPETSGGDNGDGGGTSEAMSRQGEPFDPGDGDQAAAPAGDSTERRRDQRGNRPPTTDRLGNRSTPGPALSGDRGEERPRPRPAPVVGGGPTTTSPAHSPSPSPAPTPGSGAEPAPVPPAGGRTYTAALTGNTESPPGDPDGSGRASLTLHLGREELCVAVTTSGIDPVTSVHLHDVSATSAEPMVTAAAPADDGSPTCFGVDREVLRRVRTDPVRHYIEVHNAEFPDGALRGFLSR